MFQFKINKKIVFITGGLLLALIAGFFYYQKTKSANKLAAVKNNNPENEMSIDTSAKKDMDRTIYKTGFSILAPIGWKEFGAPSDISALVRNEKEVINDQEAVKINFKTYYSAASYRLPDNNLPDYVKSFKSSLGKKITGAKFNNEKNEKISNQPAIILEYEGNQKGIFFKIMTAFIKGMNNDLWMISFNTVKGNWDKDKAVFYKIARSFKIEK
jgi:hypothetical protein